jgi:hypothetical protein
MSWIFYGEMHKKHPFKRSSYLHCEKRFSSTCLNQEPTIDLCNPSVSNHYGTTAQALHFPFHRPLFRPAPRKRPHHFPTNAPPQHLYLPLGLHIPPPAPSPPSLPHQRPRHLRLPLHKHPPLRPPHQIQRYRRPQPLLQRQPLPTRPILRRIAEEGADVAEAVGGVAGAAFDGGFDDGFDGELVGEGVAPFYEGGGDAAAAVGGVDVEDCEDWGGEVLDRF